MFFKDNFILNPHAKIWFLAEHSTGWNDKIVTLEKTTWFHFRLMKTGFLFFFFVADHLLVGQLCTNSKSLLSCVKVTQCSTSEIGDVPLYKSCSLPIQVMTTGTIASTLKMQIRTVQRLRAQLNASDDPLEVVERKAISCHLTSAKSAWKSTPKCTWMCWRVWWSPGAIRWPVANPGCGSRTRRRPTSLKRPRLGFRRSATLLLLAPLIPWPEYAGRLCLAIGRELHQHDLPQTSLIAAIRRVFIELPPRLWKRHAPNSGSVSRRWLRLKSATLNIC